MLCPKFYDPLHGLVKGGEPRIGQVGCARPSHHRINIAPEIICHDKVLVFRPINGVPNLIGHRIIVKYRHPLALPPSLIPVLITNSKGWWTRQSGSPSEKCGRMRENSNWMQRPGAMEAGQVARCPARVQLPRSALILCAVMLQTLRSEAAGDVAVPQQDFAAICEHAAVQAARVSGVPVSVLKAISLTETGRKSNGAFRPWPWTVNMEGKGFWFDSYAQALEFAKAEFARGARSFDVGCFQINYKWHHQAFTSIEQMFDPLANALYAAEFLTSLYQQKGSWDAAAGAYHSLNPKHANPYQARFETLRARFAAEDGLPLPDVSEPELSAAMNGVDPAVRREVIRINTFPLLQGGAEGLMGSLMPPDAAAGKSLLAATAPAQSLFGPLAANETQPEAPATEVEAGQAGPDIEATAETINLGAIY